jgi:hypothetical protein
MAKSFLITFLSRRPPIRPLSLLPSALNLHMTMAMTLHLAEKALVQSFGTSELSARTGSMVLILFHDQRSRSTSGLHALGVSTFLACLLPERFYPEFMICRWVSSHRSVAVNHFGSSGFRSFKLSSCTFSQSAFHLKSTILRRVSSGINGRYVRPLGLQEFLTQCNLSHISPLECPVSRLHDLSPRGEILEADMWPNWVGDTCHVLTDISILHMLKTY